MATYRVEKSGITFYIQPEQIEYYASNGWSIYKTVEEQVTDAATEAAAAAQGTTTTVSSEKE